MERYGIQYELGVLVTMATMVVGGGAASLFGTTVTLNCSN